MSFHEKSAWVMSLALLAAGCGYFHQVAMLSAAAGSLIAPLLPLLVLYTIGIVVVAVAGHVLVAVLSPRDAGAPADERDRAIRHRAGHLSGHVLTGGVLTGLGAYVVTHQGHLLFYSVFASLMLGQIAEYAVQIYLYRRGV